MGQIKTLLILIPMFTIISLTHSDCGTCGATSGIACTSETDFVVCINGAVTTIGATCPDYAYCNTNTVCANITVEPTPSCFSSCGLCTPNALFACVDTNKFQLCYGTDTPQSPVLTCPTGMVCDFYESTGSFCANADVVPAPVCSGPFVTEPVTEPTIPPVIPTQPSLGTTLDPWTQWCRNIGLAGRFAYKLDTTCKSYVLCFVNNNLLYGNYYKCTGSTVFNQKFQTCVDEANYECPS